jgi:hypothetical protein
MEVRSRHNVPILIGHDQFKSIAGRTRPQRLGSHRIDGSERLGDGGVLALECSLTTFVRAPRVHDAELSHLVTDASPFVTGIRSSRPHALTMA